MEFVKEFAIFLYKNNIIKFGNFTLASGKYSPYYIDLRLVPSYPRQFRKMIKNLQNLIDKQTGLKNFDALVSVPTGGLVIASALAIETVKPLIYVRNKSKEYGTSKLIEGKLSSNMKLVMIDDVATTGNSILNGIKQLQEAGSIISESYVVVNRLENANKLMDSVGVKLYQLTDILEITKILFEERLIDEEILEKIKKQIDQAS